MLLEGIDDDETDTRAWPEVSRRAAMLCFGGTLIALLAGFSFARGTHEQSGIIGGCKMAYMSPHYAKLDGFTRQQSRLGDKYGLYVYREVGYDRQELDGVPVLFVPGNAGSFRQVRSLASSTSRQYFNEPNHPLGHFEHERGTSHLDWFAVDFNEDFSAFHGTTLLEQSEYLNDAVSYILSLYQRSPQPSSVIAVAHSMGGISTRKMMRMPNYRPKSVNTIITLSTPHLIPPATFDHDIEHIYGDINSYWRDAYNTVSGNDTDHELRDVLLVSVSGGASDTMISSDTTSLTDLVPSSHGFTVFTTTVPQLYSPVDHLAMMWCDQLRARIARALLEMIDIERAPQVKSLSERLNAIRGQLLPQEDFDGQRGSEPVVLPADLPRRDWANGTALVVPGEAEASLHVVQLNSRWQQHSLVLLTDAKPIDLSIWLCESEAQCFLTSSNCVPEIPRSYASRPTSNDDPLQSYLCVDLATVGASKLSHIALSASKGSFSFLAAEVVPTSDLDLVINPSLFRAFLGFHVPLQPGLVANLHIPALDSVLLVYSVSLQSTCLNSAFQPLLRAHARRNYESHWHPSFKKAHVYIHGAAPFIFPRRAQDGVLNLQVWRDPTCQDTARLSIQISPFHSLGKIVLRYRTIFAAWPFAFALLVLSRQLQRHDKKRDSFQSNSRVLSHVSRHQALETTGSIVSASLLQTFFLAWLGPVSSWLPDALFGNDRFFFAIALPLALMAIVWAFTLALAFAMQLSLHVIALVWDHATRHLHLVLKNRLRPEERAEAPSPLWQRIAMIGGLSLIVGVFAPVQFAFLVLVVVQLATALRYLFIARGSPTPKARSAWHRFHYHLTITLLFVLLLPLTAPILLVWSRNLLAGYYAPFSSDRNPLRIMGFLLWTDAAHSGHPLPARGRALDLVQVAVLFSCLYILLYGIRYSYSALPLGNLIFLVLAVAHWHDETDEI